MGIKDFTKLFKGEPLTHRQAMQKISGKTIAIDASLELYRANLGMRRVTQLTDHMGRPTGYISVILSNIIAYARNNTKQIWVFDNNGTNPLKADELTKRQQAKIQAEQKLQDIQQTDILFSDDDEAKVPDVVCVQELRDMSMSQLEKRCFRLTDEVESLQYILSCLNIPWIVAPEGYEAEHLCACMGMRNIAHYAITADSDCIVFGSPYVLKRLRNKAAGVNAITWAEYDLNKLLADHCLTIDDLRKIAVILGCDFSSRTRGIGPKTVLNKFKTVKLTDEQQNAFDHFSKPCVDKIPSYIEVKQNIDDLLNWLEYKRFNRNLWAKKLQHLTADL